MSRKLVIDTSESQNSDIATLPESESPLHTWVNSIYPDFYQWMVNRDLVKKLAKKKIEASSPVRKIKERHETNMNQEIDSIEERYQSMISWIKYHLIHVTRLISYYRRIQRRQEKSGFMFHSPRMFQKQKIQQDGDLHIPVMSKEVTQKTDEIMNQYQTLLFLSDRLGLQALYQRCLRINEKNNKCVLEMLLQLESKKKELDNYYQDHFKILKQNKKQIRTEHIQKLEKERDGWIESRLESQIDEILRTQYRHGPKIEQEGMTIDKCWKEELVDFHRRFWDAVGNEKFENFESYLEYLKKQW